MQRRRNHFCFYKNLGASSLAGLIASLISISAWTAPSHFDVRVQSEPTPLSKLPRKNLYAVGLSEKGKDVIAIVNGNIYAARVISSGKMSIDPSLKTTTSDLLYSNISRWTEVPLTVDIKDREALHSFINETLVKFGYENPGTVPFLLKGKFKKSLFVAPKPSGTVELTRTGAEGLMVGFFTKKVELLSGTELTSVIHTVFEKPQAVGRISSLNFDKNRVILYLPK